MLAGAGDVADDGTLVLGAGGGIRLAARDDASGVEEVSYRWDGGPWQRWRGHDLEPPPRRGTAARHLLKLRANDRLGRESPTWQVRIERDVAGPEAPRTERTGSL